MANPKYRSAKKASGMRSRFTLLSIMLWALMVSACNTADPLVTRIIVDFPRGALRLLVQRDGDSRLFYGALPTYRAIQNSPFNIDDLFDQLRPRLHDVLPAEDRPLGQPYGMATIEVSDGSKQDYLIYDEMFALELFKTACTNLAQEEDVGEEIFSAECAKLERAAPFMNP
jgi:hypothetical protein